MRRFLFGILCAAPLILAALTNIAPVSLQGKAVAQTGIPTFGGVPLSYTRPVIGTPVSLGTNTATSGSTLTITTGAAVQQNDLLICAASLGASSLQTVSTLSDGTNSYSQAIGLTQASSYDIEIWYKAGASPVASGATITGTWSGAVTAFSMLACSRISGITPSSPLDKTNTGGAGSGTTLSVSTGTLSYANEIVIAATWWNSGTLSVNSPITQISNLTANSRAMAYGYDIVASTSSVTSAPSSTSNDRNMGLVASFKGY